MTKTAGSGSISQRYGSADPDPYQNFMDPQHCIIDHAVDHTVHHEDVDVYHHRNRTTWSSMFH
jgi:hypothetical protein